MWAKLNFGMSAAWAKGMNSSPRSGEAAIEAPARAMLRIKSRRFMVSMQSPVQAFGTVPAGFELSDLSVPVSPRHRVGCFFKIGDVGGASGRLE